MPLPKFIPFKGYFEVSPDKSLIGLSPDQQARMFRANSRSMGMPETGLKCGTVFDTYKTERISKVDAFSDIKMPGGTTLGAKLSPDPAALPAPTKKAIDDINKDINQLFDLPKDGIYEKTVKTFSEKIAAINKLYTQKPPKFNPEGLASHLGAVKSAAIKGLKEQQKKEKDQLEALFTKTAAGDSDFVKNLKTLSHLSDDQVAGIKKDMTAALDKKQQEDTSKLEKSIEEDVNQLHKWSEQEKKRIAFLAWINQLNQHNRDALRKMAKDNALANPTEATIELGHDADGIPTAYFYGIKVEDLASKHIIETVTGQELVYDKEKQCFSMQLPKFGWYYHNNRDSMVEDMTLLAAAVRACGHEGVTMNVTYDSKKFDERGNRDESYVREMGRKAYEGAIRAGFPPEKIKIKVNGKPISNDELFGEHSMKYGELQMMANDIKAESITANKPVGKKDMDQLRSQVGEIPPAPGKSGPSH